MKCLIAFAAFISTWICDCHVFSADIDRKETANGYVIESWCDDLIHSHIRFIQRKTAKIVYEATDGTQPFMGDGAICNNARYLAYAVGGASVGHTAVLLSRQDDGTWDEIEFAFEDAYVQHAVATGLLREPGQITHLYAQPVKFEKELLVIRFLGDFSLNGKQPKLPGTTFTFDPKTKRFTVVTTKSTRKK